MMLFLRRSLFGTLILYVAEGIEVLNQSEMATGGAAEVASTTAHKCEDFESNKSELRKNVLKTLLT